MAIASVLFVCMGNICRSPTGEGILRHHARDRGLDGSVRIDSAGTIAHHEGEPPDRRMIRFAAERGYDLSGQTARQVAAVDLESFDLVVAMDEDNQRDLLALAGDPDAQRRVRLLSSFLPAGAPTDVPDPYFGGDRGFHEVIDMIEQAVGPILDHLTAGDGRATS